jgi:polar amino acid transport system substrate-binding protein
MRRNSIALYVVLILAVAACGGAGSGQATQQALQTAAARPTETKAPAPTPTPEPSPLPEASVGPPPTALLPPGQDLLDAVLEAGVLVVSTDPNYPPQSFLDEAGELDGFDVDVAKEVAARLGVEVEFVTPDWDLVTAGGWGGRWDISIGSMTPTEERAQLLWFTTPYYYTPASFAVHTSNTTIQTPADLAGKTVGLGIATTYEAYLKGSLSIMGGEIAYDPPPDIKLWPYVTDAEAFKDMELGDGVRLDAVMSAQPTIQDAINEGYPLKFLGTPAFYEPLVFALDRTRGPSDAMLQRLNEIIAALREDGTLTGLSLEWYGIDVTTVQRPQGD